MSVLNPWEIRALEYNFHYHDQDDRTTTAATTSFTALASALMSSPTSTGGDSPYHDPIIYPGIYAPSGFDMMSILLRVATRPSPVVNLGPVDASCALLMCDILQPDCPVVYANEACATLTGYAVSDMLGRNCRFMQAPGGRVTRASQRRFVDERVLGVMDSAVRANREVAVEVTNFKRDGTRFTNLLAMIPVCWDSDVPRYYVGFMAEKTW